MAKAEATSDPFASPDSVPLKGKVTGITKLSRKAKLLMSMAAVGTVAGIVFSIMTVGDDTAPVASSDPNASDQAKAKGMELARADGNADEIPDGQASAVADKLGVDTSLGGGIQVGPAEVGTAKSGDAVKLPETNGAPGKQGEATPIVPAPGQGAAPAQPAETSEQAAARRARDERDEKTRQARAASIESSGAAEGVTGGAGAANAQIANAVSQAAAALAGQGKPGTGLAGLGLNGQQEQDDVNKQIRKESFLRDASASSGSTYLQETKQKPLGVYEVKAGWNIPMVLECGINSDLPGQTCARVSENVYDTVSGRHLLIPQGTKAIGMYDSRIAVGQSRLLVVWNRLIFPDGTSFVIQGMPGTDGAGNAGFDGDVNNHYARIFLGAGMMSLVSAGAQLSQPQQSSTNGTAPSAQQTIAAAMGQQLAQVSGAMIQRNMQIQPTITQMPGYRFNVTLTRDMLFPAPYGR
ncbi:TrbI/VirB10 family protein [Cupriavidus sp. D39]|uniref:TrbI/VirB10 family protein n=1 Tax=Cupriavidus sp. D39 TaxID=2997877 RepID=UPI0022702B8D|nr:TrbI/VirB10 family protein [Cupriavidus sp. D39]MCY0853044.1 hypothetical protein [Cupriavidus sp. D39]